MRAIKVIALRQKALFEKEMTKFSFDFNFGSWRSFLKGELEGNRGSPAKGETTQAGLHGLSSPLMLP